ncbi:rhomboid family intramembrane serine protease [[Brevibacterium] frigoritolerans]|nr:rhomboid family intramembrane serine protease [Peribacillus frigoritolerans]
MFERKETFKEVFRDYPITFWCITLCSLIFVIMSFDGGTTNHETLFEYGGLVTDRIYNFNEYYRLLSSMFIHSGLIHFISNIAFLLVLGIPIEKMLGKIKYVVFLFGCGLIGNLVVLFFESNPTAITVGASGMVYGLLGYYLSLVQKRVITDKDERKLIVAMVIINLILTVVVPIISFKVHIGGLIAGYIFGYLTVSRQPILTQYEEGNEQ